VVNSVRNASQPQRCDRAVRPKAIRPPGSFVDTITTDPPSRDCGPETAGRRRPKHGRWRYRGGAHDTVRRVLGEVGVIEPDAAEAKKEGGRWCRCSRWRDSGKRLPSRQAVEPGGVGGGALGAKRCGPCGRVAVSGTRESVAECAVEHVTASSLSWDGRWVTIPCRARRGAAGNRSATHRPANVQVRINSVKE